MIWAITGNTTFVWRYFPIKNPRRLTPSVLVVREYARQRIVAATMGF